MRILYIFFITITSSAKIPADSRWKFTFGSAKNAANSWTTLASGIPSKTVSACFGSSSRVKMLYAKFQKNFKISIFVPNYHFTQTFQLSLYFRFFFKNSIFNQHFASGQKFRCLSKIAMFVQNFDFCPKLRFLSKISIFTPPPKFKFLVKKNLF